MHRQNAVRGSVAVGTVSGKIAEKWKVQFTGMPSAPVIVGNSVFVADVDAHTVYALNASSGKKRWSYTAGARVDTAPTYYKGMVLFGSRDGWVTCLRASDGVLAWRFKDLPDKLIGAFGQLESAWPVSGSVLIHDDKLYFSAGRSSFLDGGMFLYALNPATGEVLHSKHYFGPFDDVNGFPVPGIKNNSDTAFKEDLLLSDGECPDSPLGLL